MDAATLNIIIGGAIGLFASLLTAVVTALVNSHVSTEREERAERRRRQQERIAQLGKIYEDALANLNAFWGSTEYSVTEDRIRELEDRGQRDFAKLHILSTTEIVTGYFMAVGDLRDELHDRLEGKEPSSKFSMELSLSITELGKLMREHLESLRNEKL